MKKISFGLFFSLLFINLYGKDFTPTSAYKNHTLVGFKFKIHPDLIVHELYPTFLKEVELQLNNLSKVLPQKQLLHLKSIVFWAEWNNKENGAAEFHPSKRWLTLNGYNPEKAEAVELSNAKNFINWSQKSQPWMILHELAHAYHHTYLSFENKDIEKAYQNAMNNKLYDSVLYIHGKKKKAYATTNKKEYFAEISEAYFGKNDYFPFHSKELELHDPVGYKVLQKLWHQ